MTRVSNTGSPFYILIYDLLRLAFVLVVMRLRVKVCEPKRSHLSAGASPSLSVATYLLTRNDGRGWSSRDDGSFNRKNYC